MKTAKNYLYRHDFTAHREELLAMEVGDHVPLRLADILKGVTGDPWQSDGESAFNTNGAQVEYSGVNRHKFASNSRYKKIVIVRLAETCTMFPEQRLVFQIDFE